MQPGKKCPLGESVASSNVETRGAADNGDIEVILARKLQDAFAPVLKEPIPDRFVELLERIASQGKPK